MRYNISGNDYTFNANIRDNEQIRRSFNELAQKTFELSFEQWYQNGYWGDSYIPHVLLDNGRVIANASVNIIKTLWQNKSKCYIQLGTVMTDPEYRNKGLASFLLNTIIAEWEAKCDAIYLFANDSVLGFYPKFGFVAANEYQSEMTIKKLPGAVRKLDMSAVQDRDLLLSKYAQSNPFSALPMVGNAGLLMFYCSQFLNDKVYYVEEYDAIVIVEYDEDSFLCYDIFCSDDKPLREILSIAALDGTQKVVFGFPLKQGDNYRFSKLKEEDITLFVFSDKENIFSCNQVMIPLLAHA